MKFESAPNQVEKAVMENYWRSMETKGRHVLALSAEYISEALSRFHELPINEIKVLVLKTILESPEPEDLRPEAVEIIFDGIMNGEKIFIWTVGDEGEYVDEERHVAYPEYNFQRRKIGGSGLMKTLQERALKETGDSRIITENISLDINAENKIASLRKILKELSQKDVRQVFVVDDQQGNIRAVEELQKDFPEIAIHTWWLNNSSDKGDISAFKKYIEEQRKIVVDPFALVLDWDDTIYDELKRMKRTVHNLEQSLNNPSGLV